MIRHQRQDELNLQAPNIKNKQLDFPSIPKTLVTRTSADKINHDT